MCRNVAGRWEVRRSVIGKLLEILVYSGATVIEKKPKKVGVIFFFHFNFSCI